MNKFIVFLFEIKFIYEGHSIITVSALKNSRNSLPIFINYPLVYTRTTLFYGGYPQSIGFSGPI